MTLARDITSPSWVAHEDAFMRAHRRLVDQLEQSWFRTPLRARMFDVDRYDAKIRRIARGARLLAHWRRARIAPEIHDFVRGVTTEAEYQRAHWGSEHDAGKTPADWFWLVGYLAGKALAAHIAGNTDKALHHTISTAAALCNWHAAILGKMDMRPGIAEEKQPKEQAP